MERDLDNNLKKIDYVAKTQSIKKNKFNNESNLRDLGNEIAFVVSRYFDKKKPGFTKEDFMIGLEYGFSIFKNKHFKEDD